MLPGHESSNRPLIGDYFSIFDCAECPDVHENTFPSTKILLLSTTCIYLLLLLTIPFPPLATLPSLGLGQSTEAALACADLPRTILLGVDIRKLKLNLALHAEFEA